MCSRCFSRPKEFYFVFSLFTRPYQSTNSQEHIALVKYVHSKLAAICSESGLEGIRYIGGPFCPYCKGTVLHLVWYQERQKHCCQKRTKGGENPIADKLNIRCVKCCKDSNVYELLTPDKKCHPGS